MPVLRLQTLGPFNTTLDDQPIYNFKTNKVQALLIYLAVERDRIHQRESLMELFWPDMPLESAQVNLRQTIYRLRHAIPVEWLQANGGGNVSFVESDRNTVKINPDVELSLDIEKFHSLIDEFPDQAVALYRGDFLADFYLADSSEFEFWSEKIRENTRQKILKALDLLTENNLRVGEFEQAQKFAWKQLEIDKLREIAYRQLMTALANAGQRSAALSQFQICRRQLDEELGLEPSQETIKIYHQIQSDALKLAKSIPTQKTQVTKEAMPIFLLTDIEGSTRLWDQHHEAMLPALLKHNQILEERISQHGGRILELRGDGVKAVFEGVNPLACMIAIQKDLGNTDWGAIGTLKIRMGLHGLPVVRKGYDYFVKDQKYYGPVLNHTARIMDAGWGGQILVSERVRNVCSLPPGASWENFGEHQVKSLDKPLQIFGLCHPDLPMNTFPPLRTLNNQASQTKVEPIKRKHNLPLLATSFIGRTKELQLVDDLIRNPNIHLVTIMGPGGMGKTRLALAIAERYIHPNLSNGTGNLFPDGVFFVPLAPLNSIEQIIPKIVNTLNVPFESAQTTERTPQAEDQQKVELINFLQNKRMLIILDNFEHLLDGADLISDILEVAPKVQILATSRERLQIHGEQVFPLQGLEYPSIDHPDNPSDFTAMELFLDCAHRVSPDFDLGFEDLIYLTRICNLLGGMPLGLELAASWVDMLSMKDIASEIKRSIDFLETEMRNIPTRHRSIRAVFDSSWEYLSENEKEIFPKFSVFRGGFSRDAAQEVTGATIRVLAKFVHKSLIQYNQDEDCYHIHELLRQYGQEHLDKSIHKFEQTKSHHSRYYCKIVRDQTSSLMTGDYTSYEKIEAKLPNIQGGLLWAIAQGDLMNIDQAIDGICMFYDWHWRVEDARSITDSTQEMLIGLFNQSHPISDLSNQENTIKRILAKVLSWQGYFNLYHDYKSALNTLNESLSIVNSLISSGVEAHIEKTHILFFLGITNYLSGELNSAKVCFQESLALSQEIKNEFMVLKNLFSLGDTARTLGTPREAKTWYEKSLKEARRTKNLWGEITALRGLGWASRRLMDFDGAKQIFEESLSLSISNNKPIDQIRALESLGYLTLYQGKFSKAIEYFSNAISISTDLGIPNRTYSCQVHIGVSYWLQGKLIEAEPYIASGLKIVPDNDPGWTEFFFRVFYAEYLTMVGRYTEAKEQISLANAKFGKHGLDRFISGRATRTLGWIAIAEKDYIEAVRQFEASIKLFKIDTDDEQIAWSQAGLALGRMGEGKWEAAKDSLIDALWTTFEIKAFIPLLFTLPMTLLILSKDNPALAGQVYAQIQTSPFLASAPFFKDTIYDFLPANIFSKPGITSEGEIDFNNSLWLTASKVLSGWIQVWMDDPAPRMIPSTKGK